MSHPLSKQTRVFPFASGRTVTTEGGEKLFPYDHVLNEQNISNMIKTVIDNQNYLIHFDRGSGSVKFVIGGYYFDTVVPSLDLMLPLSDLWVTVSEFKEDENERGYQYLSAEDRQGGLTNQMVFTGVYFSRTEPSDSLGTSLKIISNGHTNTAAFIKFDPKSIAGYLEGSVNLSDDLNFIRESINRLSNDIGNEIYRSASRDNEHTQSIGNNTADITAIKSRLTWKPL